MKRIIFILFILFSTSSYSQWQHIIMDMDPLTDFYFTDSLKGISVGYGYSPLKTWNGGLNWFFPQGLEDFVNGRLCFVNAKLGFCYGYSINKTTDFGDTWKNVTPPGFHNFSAMEFINDSTGYVVAHHGAIYITRDGGDTWEDISYEISDDIYYYSVHFYDQNNGWVYGDDYKLKTTNGGKNWTKTGFSEIIRQQCFLDAKRGFALEWGRGKVMKTTNGGDSWNFCNLPHGYYDGELHDIHFLNENIGYVSGSVAKEGYGYGRVYKTTDGGNTWKILYDADISSCIYHVFFVNENNGWASSGYGILRTINGGITFTPKEDFPELQTSLLNNYPNPFNSSTIIEYTVNEPGEVTISLYDILGREIREILNEYKNAGHYKLNLNASALPSGSYFYQMRTKNSSHSKTMILLK